MAFPYNLLNSKNSDKGQNPTISNRSNSISLDSKLIKQMNKTPIIPQINWMNSHNDSFNYYNNLKD